MRPRGHNFTPPQCHSSQTYINVHLLLVVFLNLFDFFHHGFTLFLFYIINCSHRCIFHFFGTAAAVLLLLTFRFLLTIMFLCVYHILLIKISCISCMWLWVHIGAEAVVRVSRITYTVLVETLNPAQSNPIREYGLCSCVYWALLSSRVQLTVMQN